MNFLLTALVCFALIELAIRLPFSATLQGLGALERSFGKGAAGSRLAAASALRLLGYILGLMAFVLLMLHLMHYVSDEIEHFVLSWAGLAFMINISCLYWFARRSGRALQR